MSGIAFRVVAWGHRTPTGGNISGRTMRYETPSSPSHEQSKHETKREGTCSCPSRADVSSECQADTLLPSSSIALRLKRYREKVQREPVVPVARSSSSFQGMTRKYKLREEGRMPNRGPPVPVLHSSDYSLFGGSRDSGRCLAVLDETSLAAGQVCVAKNGSREGRQRRCFVSVSQERRKGS